MLVLFLLTETKNMSFMILVVSVNLRYSPFVCNVGYRPCNLCVVGFIILIHQQILTLDTIEFLIIQTTHRNIYIVLLIMCSKFLVLRYQLQMYLYCNMMPIVYTNKPIFSYI